MKELKIFGTVILLTVIISIIAVTMFFYFDSVFFPHKSSGGGGFIDFTPKETSSNGYKFVFSALMGVYAGVPLSVLVSILSSVFLATMLRSIENIKLPIWSIFIFSIFIGGISFCFFYFVDEGSVKYVVDQRLYQLISSFVWVTIIVFLPLITSKKLFNL